MVIYKQINKQRKTTFTLLAAKSLQLTSSPVTFFFFISETVKKLKGNSVTEAYIKHILKILKAYIESAIINFKNLFRIFNYE